MRAILSAACCSVRVEPDWAAEPKHRLRRGPPAPVYVVLTDARVFTFTALGRALKFLRRARRCPSMAGKSVEFINTTANGSMRGVR
jgi:hypothetical protein